VSLVAPDTPAADDPRASRACSVDARFAGAKQSHHQGDGSLRTIEFRSPVVFATALLQSLTGASVIQLASGPPPSSNPRHVLLGSDALRLVLITRDSHGLILRSCLPARKHKCGAALASTPPRRHRRASAISSPMERCCRSSSSKFSGASQDSYPARIDGQSSSVIAYHAVSRLRPLTIWCLRKTPSNVKPKRPRLRSVGNLHQRHAPAVPGHTPRASVILAL
jgi:hypothetical protein